MNATDEFSLRQVILSVLEETDSEDRDQIIKEVERRIPRKSLGDALHQALPAYVRMMGGSTVRLGSPLPKPGSDDGKDNRASGRSSKVEAIREAWSRHLEGRYTVADGSWRRLADFTHADLVYKARELEAQARSRTARAAVMTALAERLERTGAARVGELPADVLRESLAAVPDEDTAA
jgi:hypothetical protein